MEFSTKQLKFLSEHATPRTTASQNNDLVWHAIYSMPGKLRKLCEEIPWLLQSVQEQQSLICACLPTTLAESTSAMQLP